MTYHKIKSICYQNASRKILLQNENGPCPLLAVTNILLLRGNIDLPTSCVRNNNAVNTSDVITMLANYALSRTATTSTSASTSTSNNIVEKNEEDVQNKQYLLNELMQILPNLQYGLDINPKFTNDVEGYEHTQATLLFDLLGVDLVHGWLIDEPHCDSKDDDNKKNHDDDMNDDENHGELFDLIKDKSYNECIEIVIKSNEAELHCDKMHTKNNENNEEETKDENNEETKDKNNAINDDEESDDWINVQSTDDNNDHDHDEEEEEEAKKIKELKETIKKGKLINNFLSKTSHQLTYYGIHKLQMKLHSENDLKVFFRNNHFSIITKCNDMLYLLITDAGYVNNSTIIWERLDNIDGNTDYYDSFFQLHLIATAANDIGNGDYCYDNNNVDVDYQLALQLSKETLNTSNNAGAAATNNNNNIVSNSTTTATQDESKFDNCTRAILPTRDDNDNDEIISENNKIIDNDQAYAYALQSQQQEEHKSELLARKLQKEEYERRNNRSNNNNNTNTNANNAQKSCVIS